MMRTRLFVALLSIGTLITCGGKSDNPNSPSGSAGAGGSSSSSSGTMSATIDGVKWTATSVSADYAPATNNVGASLLNIVGLDSPQSVQSIQTVGIGIGNGKVGTPLTTGTYDIPAINTALGSLSIGLSPNAYTAKFGTAGSSGSITLSTFNTSTKKATGTFNFVMVSATGLKKTITDGTFSVTYK